jgi:hypothetical protein
MLVSHAIGLVETQISPIVGCSGGYVCLHAVGNENSIPRLWNAHICLWDRSDLEWDGLCSHCSLFEGIHGDFGLTAEEIEALSTEKMFARALRTSATSPEWDRDQRENNRDEYLEK